MSNQAGEIPDLETGPFILCETGTRPPKPRRLDTPEGLGDRLRTAAFAEWQAISAFSWAAEYFQDAPANLRRDWAEQVSDEVRHFNLIRDRMAELGVDLADRPVSDVLWESLKESSSGQEFCQRIASAEERGRQAALKVVEFLENDDPATAAIFLEIAADEVAHVALAKTYYGWVPD